MKRHDIQNLWSEFEGGNAQAALAGLEGPDELPLAARTLRGLSRTDGGDLEGAHADFTAVLERQPENPVARLHRGLVHFKLGDRKAAAADFQAGPLFPHPGWLKRALSLFWPLHFDHPEIMGFAEPEPAGPMPLQDEASRLLANPESIPSRESRALAAKMDKRAVKFYLKGKVREALRLGETAHALDPANIDYLNDMAWFLLRLGRGPEARALFEPQIEEAIAKYRERPGRDRLPHFNLLAAWAWSLHECGEHRGALAVLSTMRPQGPDDYLGHLIAALSWAMLGEDKKADLAFDKALGPFFLDTWQQFLQPFFQSLFAWLEAGDDFA